MKHFDYIFSGSGLAALMTVNEMVLSKNFESKTILLIDKNTKKTNDRTWCFWDNKIAAFDEIIYKKWNLITFKDSHFSKNFDINPYQYNQIRGLDFYYHIFENLKNHPNISFCNQKVVSFEETTTGATIKTETETFSCSKLINSIFKNKEAFSDKKYPYLQQHFIGWFVTTKEAVFNSDCATFMDFSVAQKGNTRFMYVLPTSPKEALVEYTLFSKDLLLDSQYEAAIKLYLKNLNITEYTITETERGNIPMSCYPFWKQNSKNIINIGSAGGWTKASTGFTFKNTTKYSKKLTSFLNQKDDFRDFHKKNKFWWYDLLFLDVLFKNNELGGLVFASMFQKSDPKLILKFLDEETTFLEDLSVMLKCPKKLFIKAFFNRIFKF